MIRPVSRLLHRRIQSTRHRHCTACPTRYRVRHFFNNFTTNQNICNEIWSGLTSLCKKCDDIITCAGSGHHLRPDRIEPGAPYFGKSLPGTWATALARSDAAWLFLVGISERDSLPKQTTNHRHLESKHHWRNSGSDSGHTGKDFPKYVAPGSILSGRNWWPLPAHVMMSHFLHNELSPLQILLQCSHWW